MGLSTVRNGRRPIDSADALALLALAPAWDIYKPRRVVAPAGLWLLMMALTAY
jgi:hypothetical protein